MMAAQGRSTGYSFDSLYFGSLTNCPTYMDGTYTANPYLGGVMTSGPQGLQNLYAGTAAQMYQAQLQRLDYLRRQQDQVNQIENLKLRLAAAKPWTWTKCALKGCEKQAEDNAETLCSEHWGNLERWRSHGKNA